MQEIDEIPNETLDINFGSIFLENVSHVMIHYIVKPLYRITQPFDFGGAAFSSPFSSRINSSTPRLISWIA